MTVGESLKQLIVNSSKEFSEINTRVIATRNQHLNSIEKTRHLRKALIHVHHLIELYHRDIKSAKSVSISSDTLEGLEFLELISFVYRNDKHISDVVLNYREGMSMDHMSSKNITSIYHALLKLNKLIINNPDLFSAFDKATSYKETLIQGTNNISFPK